jgi:hypothetical protein
VPESRLPKKIDSQINRQAFEKIMELPYHSTQGRPSHPPLVVFKPAFGSDQCV